jgi:hypothetical protein
MNTDILEVPKAAKEKPTQESATPPQRPPHAHYNSPGRAYSTRHAGRLSSYRIEHTHWQPERA